MLSLACLADSAIISSASKKITVTKVHTLLAEQKARKHLSRGSKEHNKVYVFNGNIYYIPEVFFKSPESAGSFER